MNSNKNVWMALIVVAIIAITALFTPGVREATQAAYGNVVNGNFTTFSGLFLQTANNQMRYGSEENGNGQNIYSIQRLAMTSGTTSPCSMLSPAATSTLLSYSLVPTVGTTTAATFVIATGTTPYVITSSLVVAALNYVPMGSFETIPTTTLVANIPPSTYVNLGLTAASASGGFVMTGFCTAEFLTQ